IFDCIVLVQGIYRSARFSISSVQKDSFPFLLFLLFLKQITVYIRRILTLYFIPCLFLKFDELCLFKRNKVFTSSNTCNVKPVFKNIIQNLICCPNMNNKFNIVQNLIK